MYKYVFALLVLSSCTVVSPGQRGIPISMGTTADKEVSNGTYLWLPFFKGMVKMDVQIQKNVVEANAASKDTQEVHTKVAVNWSLDTNKLVEIYNTIGDEDDVDNKIIDPAVSEVLKSATAHRTANELLSERTALKVEIDTALKLRLKPYGVIIHDVSLTDFRLSEEFMKAVERKQIAEQKAKEAEYDAVRATKEADGVYNSAVGQAKAQNLLKTSITPELLKLKYLEKWDGKLPNFMSGSSTGVMLNIDATK